MTNHWSEDIARPHHGSTESARVLISPVTPTTAPAQTPADDEWRSLIEGAIGGNYGGSSSSRPRRGRAKCPPAIRGHACGHQCASISPRLLAAMGGRAAACRRLCSVQLDPREDDNDSPHRRVASWYSREAWLRRCSQTYDRRYRSVRPILVKMRAGKKKNNGGGIAKEAFMQVCAIMANAADSRTGRDSRLSLAQIVAESGMSKTQVSRVRLSMLLMGVATEVLRGRQRTLAERMASWRVGDRSRGWASVWALHAPRNLAAVDNPVDNSPHICAGQSSMATHPYRGHFFEEKVTNTLTHLASNCGKRGASRPSIDKRPGKAKVPTFTQKALVLTLRWLADSRTPAWAHRYHPYVWAEVLEAAAERDWWAAELNDAFRFREATEVRWPLAYVRETLDRLDLDLPPHVIHATEEAVARHQAEAVNASIDAWLADEAAKKLEADQERRQLALNGAGRREAFEVLDDVNAKVDRKAAEEERRRARWTIRRR